MDRKQKMKQGLQGKSIFSNTEAKGEFSEPLKREKQGSFQTITQKGKLRTYTERVTLPLSLEQVEFLQGFVQQARRANKVKGLNINSVLRALVDNLMATKDNDLILAQVKTEDDLQPAIKKILS